MSPRPALFVATGAYDCGKTTTLEWLRDTHGVEIHTEAHRVALAKIADRCHGHPPDRGYAPIDDPDHFCPMCQPQPFAAMVLAEQRAIEARASPGALLERGYLDPIEMLERTAPRSPRPAWQPLAHYRRVFLFAVMPALAQPRWGKSIATRVAEAEAINARLARMYTDAGFELVEVAPGTVAARGAFVHRHMSA